MIKDIHIQSCLNCRPKSICDCDNKGFGFEIKDCKRINLLVGNHGVGKSFTLAHVNFENKPFVQIIGSGSLPPIETINIENVQDFELGIADGQWINCYDANKFLVLDKIGNNTHYSVHKPFWINLIKQIIKYDLQVFATTQSYDMIKALVEAAKETDLIEKDYIRLFKIRKTSKEEILVGDYNAEEIEAKVESGLEVR
jgi:AAA15 family ATPase/GTPase